MFQEILKNYRYGYKRVSSKLEEDNSFLKAPKEKYILKSIPKNQ
jgi:hypothetical protein